MSNELSPLPGDVTEFDENGPVHMRRIFNFTRDQMREYGRACERAAYERARHIVRTYKVPVGNSPAGEMACEWTIDALREIDDAIAALGAEK